MESQSAMASTLGHERASLGVGFGLRFSSVGKTSDLRHIANKALVRACRARGGVSPIFGSLSRSLGGVFPCLWESFPVFGVLSPFSLKSITPGHSSLGGQLSSEPTCLCQVVVTCSNIFVFHSEWLSLPELWTVVSCLCITTLHPRTRVHIHTK
ncbi:hypothetical protein SCLCIDRAFT_199524 [Scleroderma citrinum Foug A]|uniref:Uncharacterized protein n=1 Tax=Scleroderma citrinum Foug A TaxID=1036808 RepID=A0A0C3DLH9_9AGAM|nr:hypothetical protein SCLCIDRAFT_199524 [Scleroderma citrinum Foug A]